MISQLSDREVMEYLTNTPSAFHLFGNNIQISKICMLLILNQSDEKNNHGTFFRDMDRTLVCSELVSMTAAL